MHRITRFPIGGGFLALLSLAAVFCLIATNTSLFMTSAAAANPDAASGEAMRPHPHILYVEIPSPESAGKSLELRREELLEFESTERSQVYIPYIGKTVEATILPLSALLDHLDLSGEPSVLANSYDGYFSIYRPDFIEEFEPYLVLTFTGEDKGKMQLGNSPNLGPYYITFEAQPKKGSAELFDPDNKRPFGVNQIQVGSYESLMAPLHAGALENLEEIPLMGRKLFVNNCMSCHAWEETGLGGVLSNRTSTILAIHARFNRQYFNDYVVEPARFLPDVAMPAHPHYSKEQIDAIAEFLILSAADEI